MCVVSSGGNIRYSGVEPFEPQVLYKYCLNTIDPGEMEEGMKV